MGVGTLIDGPYVEALDDGGALRGSSNQRVIPLRETYRAHLDGYGAQGRVQERFYHGIQVHEIGIPQGTA